MVQTMIDIFKLEVDSSSLLIQFAKDNKMVHSEESLCSYSYLTYALHYKYLGRAQNDPLQGKMIIDSP